MPTMKPFADDATALSIGELKIENGQDRIALYGSLERTAGRLRRLCPYGGGR